jgi:transcriptional regulator with XRE-family HTH domain
VSNSEAAALLQKLGRQVAAVRRSRKLSQERFAEQIGISAGYLRRIETGRENLTVESIAKLATGLGLSIWDLLEPPTGR